MPFFNSSWVTFVKNVGLLLNSTGVLVSCLANRGPLFRSVDSCLRAFLIEKRCEVGRGTLWQSQRKEKQEIVILKITI